MELLTRYDWPSEAWDHIECRVSDSYQWAMTCPPFAFNASPRPPRAQLQPGEKKQTQVSENEERLDVQRNDPHRPSTGRTSALGRKVEKPADVKPAGPSGQRDICQHDRLHANK